MGIGGNNNNFKLQDNDSDPSTYCTPRFNKSDKNTTKLIKDHIEYGE
jgi:hypothetical protein